MKKQIPSMGDLVSRLKELSEAQIKALSSESGVSESTLWKIRFGVTLNPGVETFRKIFDALPRKPRKKKCASRACAADALADSSKD